MSWVPRNPTFENVVRDEAVLEEIRRLPDPDCQAAVSWAEAEIAIADFFSEYAREMHPCKDARGHLYYNYNLDLIRETRMGRPQSVNLYDILGRTFNKENENNFEPDLTELKEVFVGLIETGQRHDWHFDGAPKPGKHPCAR